MKRKAPQQTKETQRELKPLWHSRANQDRSTGADPSNILSVDLSRFGHHLDHWDVSEYEKAEYLGLVWQIVCQFVDLGYGIHPLNAAAQQSCGQSPEIAGDGARAVGNAVNLESNQSIGITDNAATERAAEREES